MRCCRCQGFMIEDRFDPEQGDSPRMVAWRCINCGEVLDAVIQHHRYSPSSNAPLVRRTHPRPPNSGFDRSEADTSRHS